MNHHRGTSTGLTARVARRAGAVLAATCCVAGAFVATSAPIASGAERAGTAAVTVAAATDHGKPRVLLTNDGEVDDMDSFIRYLYYANEFDTEGIVLTSSTFHWAGNGGAVAPFRWTGTEWIDDYIDKYGAIYPNLSSHADGYPTPEYLRSIYKIGNITNVGEMDEVTPGSELIKERILDSDPRPLYVLAWGGTNSLARALKSIEEQYAGSPEWPGVQKTISDKVVVYNILTQDNTLAGYIRPHWPAVKVIDNQGAFWGFAYAWTRVVPQPLQATLKGDWLSENIIDGHGPLAYEYRTMRDGKPTPGDDQNNRWRPDQNLTFGVKDFLSEGDSPSFLYLLDFNGLRSSEDPTWGGWGGRFAPNASGWVDTRDQNPYATCGGGFVDPCKAYAQVRWTTDLQHDFAARVAWGDTPSKSAANHNPTVTVAQGLDVRREAGAVVPINVSAGDPDGDAVTVSTWQYQEPGTYPGTVALRKAGNGAWLLTVPKDAQPGQTIHVIVQATDDGSPSLSRYARVVVTVK